MNDRPRFTLTLTLRDVDREAFDGGPISLAIGVDAALRISTRAVGEMKMGADLGVSTMSMGEVVTLMRTKEVRRKIFKDLALQLAAQMADRMEDAEGWHDPDRIEPAREQLGGSWRMSILDNEGHDPLGFGNLPSQPQTDDVFYTYTPQEQKARSQIIKMIEAEKAAYLERIEPLLRMLGNIPGTPHMVVRTAPR